MPRALSVLMAAVLLVPASLVAQATGAPRLSLTTTLGGTLIPDALGQKCGRNAGGPSSALELGAGAVLRPWRLLVVQADARTAGAVGSGCSLVGFEVDTAYSGSAGSPLNTSSIRIGVETPASLPLLRVTAGLGRVWGAPGQQFTVIGGALGTRGRRRLLLEVDYLRANVSATETRWSVAPRPITVRPNWFAVRAGMEWSLRE